MFDLSCFPVFGTYHTESREVDLNNSHKLFPLLSPLCLVAFPSS